MNHLDIETIINYVTINEVNEETKALAGKVCGHIIRCKECMEKVNAFLTVYEAISGEMENEQIYDHLLQMAENINMRETEYTL